MGAIPAFIAGGILLAAAVTSTGEEATGRNLGAVTGGDFTARQIIDARCSSCHGTQRIDDAVKQQKDMEQITRSMEKKGVRLTDKEREVLGIYWKQTPYKNR